MSCQVAMWPDGPACLVEGEHDVHHGLSDIISWAYTLCWKSSMVDGVERRCISGPVGECPIHDVGGPVFNDLPRGALPPDTNAGQSTCPFCKRVWLVTPWDDYFVPACGCSFEEANYPCESCGMAHYRTCKP